MRKCMAFLRIWGDFRNFVYTVHILWVISWTVKLSNFCTNLNQNIEWFPELSNLVNMCELLLSYLKLSNIVIQNFSFQYWSVRAPRRCQPSRLHCWGALRIPVPQLHRPGQVPRWSWLQGVLHLRSPHKLPPKIIWLSPGQRFQRREPAVRWPQGCGGLWELLRRRIEHGIQALYFFSCLVNFLCIHRDKSKYI